VASLYRAIDTLTAQERPFIADSILDPIHFGFTESVVRYHDLRQHYPAIEIMVGTGNLTELTDADTAGMNALLLGILSELRVQHLLSTQVSPHACRVVRELDAGRRIMFAAREDNRLPRGYDPALLVAHDRRPFPYADDEIAEMAMQIRDPSYRIQVSETGMHVYNRDGYWRAQDAFALFPQLQRLESDAPHAFYMGAELARAEIAWQLGKRYTQDEGLDWRSGARTRLEKQDHDTHAFKPEGTTRKASKKKGR
jgi:dihydropteroate synthase-like protein